MRGPRKWLRPALDECQGDVAQMRFLARHRSRIDALLELDLRDRWGYPLKPIQLAEIADFVVLDPDQDADRLALGMLLGTIPQFCSGYDTPAEDDLLEEVIRTIKSATTGGTP